MPRATRRSGSDKSRPRGETKMAPKSSMLGETNRLPPTLETLTPELQQNILHYVSRKKDLKKICLTSRALRDATLPQLYREVVIDLNQCKWPKLNGFFLEENAGRRLTRVLRFMPGGGCIPNDTEKWRVMRLAIKLLDRDTLLELRVPFEGNMDPDFLLMLVLDQRRLVKLQLGTIGKAAMQSVEESPLFSWNWLSEMKTLEFQVWASTAEEFEAQHKFVSNCKKLTNLNLPIHRTLEWEKKRLDSMRSAQATDKTKVITSFGSRDSQSLNHLQLQRLKLRHASLLRPPQSFVSSIQFQLLVKLDLEKCSGAPDLLVYLTTKFAITKPLLKEFFYSGDKIGKKVLHPFLRAFSGLRSFGIDYTDHAPQPDYPQFDLKCLELHFNTLQFLGVRVLSADNIHNNAVETSLDNLPTIAKMVNLVDLAIALPIDSFNLCEYDDLGPALDILATLPKLRILRILNWPDAESLLDDLSCPSHPDLGMHYATLVLEGAKKFVDKLAQKMFRRLTNNSKARPPALCFQSGKWYHLSSIPDDEGENILTLDPLCYVAIQSMDYYGKATIEAKSISHEILHSLEFGGPIWRTNSMLSWLW